MIKLSAHMLAGLLIKSNIKNGGLLMWMELYLSTIKIHPDFLLPDVGKNCDIGENNANY